MDAIEEKLKEISKGKRVTLEDVKNEIKEKFFVLGSQAFGVERDHPLGLLTICCLVMQNGFTVHGVSACADPANFNEEIGREIAERNAISVAWGHMGYELRSRLHAQEKAVPDSYIDRMRLEAIELKQKIDRLIIFTGDNDIYNNLSDMEKQQLSSQRTFMEHYHDVLLSRIAFAENKDK